MFLKRAWIPVIAGLALVMGCDSKPSDGIPVTAPMAAKEPSEILAHLKYVAVRKDFKDLPVIAPSDMTGLYGNAAWFHDHAAFMNLSLSDEEIQGLGITELKNLGYIAPGVSSKDLQEAKDKLDKGTLAKLPAEMEHLDPLKLDKLPNNLSRDKNTAKDAAVVSGAMLRPVFNAGIYRLMKGVPTALWNDIVVLEVKKQNVANTKDMDVILGYKGKPIMQVAVRPKSDGNYGIIFIYFKVAAKTLAKLAAEAQAGN